MRGYPVGTTRMWGKVLYQKQGDGSWKPHQGGDPTEIAGEAHPQGAEAGQPKGGGKQLDLFAESPRQGGARREAEAGQHASPKSTSDRAGEEIMAEVDAMKRGKRTPEEVLSTISRHYMADHIRDDMARFYREHVAETRKRMQQGSTEHEAEAARRVFPGGGLLLGRAKLPEGGGESKLHPRAVGLLRGAMREGLWSRVPYERAADKEHLDELQRRGLIERRTIQDMPMYRPTWKVPDREGQDGTVAAVHEALKQHPAPPDYKEHATAEAAHKHAVSHGGFVHRHPGSGKWATSSHGHAMIAEGWEGPYDEKGRRIADEGAGTGKARILSEKKLPSGLIHQEMQTRFGGIEHFVLHPETRKVLGQHETQEGAEKQAEQASLNKLRTHANRAGNGATVRGLNRLQEEGKISNAERVNATYFVHDGAHYDTPAHRIGEIGEMLARSGHLDFGKSLDTRMADDLQKGYDDGRYGLLSR